MRLAFPVVLMLFGDAWGHPSFTPRSNNRYVKLTLLRDRVRLAYSVLYGDLPAQLERRRMDTDADGRVSEAERAPLLEALGHELERTLRVELDGGGVPVRFSERVAGMDEPRVGPFPFSIDLCAWLPLTARTEHELQVYDGFALEDAGEREVVVEEGPDVHLRKGSQTRFLHSGTGPAAPIHVRFGIGRTSPPSEGRSDARSTALAVCAVFLALGSAAALVWRRVRRRPATASRTDS